MNRWLRVSLGATLLWPVLSAVAQNTNSGEIRGVVTDSAGAVIPGATVKVDDVDKGVSHIFTTDSAGLYDTGSIVPDHYLITISAPSFQSYVRGPITLQVGTVTIDASLTVGAATQQVVVKTDVPLLQTESGEQTATLESKQLLQLPQVGADWENFVILLPGASSKQVNGRNGQSASINGNLPYNTVLADGATTTLPMSENSDIMVLETVAEVKIDDSAFSAQYGIGGVSFNQISKGGTNTFHGAVYEYFQNDALNAAPYSFSSTPNKVSVLRYNNFGGSVGGPILKDKLFFYFNYDKTINNGGATPSFKTVPTDAMRAGDFTGQATIYDPASQTVDATGVVHRISFADEYGNGNRIPASRIDPVAAAITAYYPKANTSGITNVDSATGGTYVTNNYTYATPGKNPFTKFFGRIDYQINQNNHMIVSETESDNPAVYRNEGICPIDCQNGDVSRDNAQVSEVWTISPRTINEVRLGFTDQLNFFTPFSINQGFPDKLGLKISKADIFPQVNIQGNGAGNFLTLQPASNSVYKEMVFDPSDVVTLIRGRHVLHFGGEFLINRADSTAWGNITGANLTYKGNYTAANVASQKATGLGYADFLLGYTQGWNAGVTPEYGGRMKSPQLFVQDDIKVKPNLTINVGLRWQGMTGWHEVKGNLASFDPEVINPANGQPGAMWYGVTKAHGRDSLEAPSWNTFLPRFGFSYAYGPKTVLRGGVGLYGYTWSADAYGPGLGGAFGSSGSLSDNTNGVNPVVLLSSDGNTNYQGAGGKSINAAYLTAPTTPDARNGQSVGYQMYHTPVPKILQWNVQVQQQLGTDTVVTLGYVASHGYNLIYPVDINQVPANRLSPDDASGATNARPYPLFQGINDGGTGTVSAGGTNDSYSNYNSLQTTVQHRLSKGLEFNTSYVWSHMLDTADSGGWGSSVGYVGYQNAHDVSSNYGASNFDVRNAFKASAIYDLPFGRGRTYLNNNTLVDTVLGGWQIAPTIVWTSGIPFTPRESTNTSYSQAGDWFPNQVGNPNPSHRTLKEWYDPNAYATPTPGTFGNVRRNSLYGPSYFLPNLAVGKTFHLYERVNFELRASSFNFINHPSFDLPNAVVGGGNTPNISNTSVGPRTMQLYGRISF